MNVTQEVIIVQFKVTVRTCQVLLLVNVLAALKEMVSAPPKEDVDV